MYNRIMQTHPRVIKPPRIPRNSTKDMSLVSSVVLCLSLCSHFLPHFTYMQIRLTADSGLPVGLNVSVSGCLCVCPMMGVHSCCNSLNRNI